MLIHADKGISFFCWVETHRRLVGMLWMLIVVFILLWLLGLFGNFGGSLIHLLLVAALALFVIGLISGRDYS